MAAVSNLVLVSPPTLNAHLSVVDSMKLNPVMVISEAVLTGPLWGEIDVTYALSWYTKKNEFDNELIFTVDVVATFPWAGGVRQVRDVGEV